MNLKFNRRQRLPELNLRVINDEVLDRKIKNDDALRKIRDDSFDGVIEIRQAIYSGGKVNASIRKAKELTNNISLQKRRYLSLYTLLTVSIYKQYRPLSFIIML